MYKKKKRETVKRLVKEAKANECEELRDKMWENVTEHSKQLYRTLKRPKKKKRSALKI